MRYLAYIILYLTPVCLQAQSANTSSNPNPNGYNTFYYDNGTISSEGTLREGKPDGYWKTYYPTGTIKSEGNRKDFLLDSIWKFYNEQGILTTELKYKNGKKNGPKKTFDNKKGFIILSENFESDIKQGKTIEYHQPESDNSKQGRVKQIIPFANGLEEGTGYEYLPDSTLITITQYKAGYIIKEDKINRTDRYGMKQGMWVEFYPNGNVKKESDYWNDKLDGYVKEYNIKGSLIKSVKYINGTEQVITPEFTKSDIKVEYYDNGTIKNEGAFIDGKEEGLHRKYSPEGKPEMVKLFNKGILCAEGFLDTIGNKQGTWTEFHPNGSIKAKGFYKNNKKVGDWIYYYENGKLEQIGKYDGRGRAQGNWEWYYPCKPPCKADRGILKKKEHYDNDRLEGDFVEYNDSGKVITQGQYIDNEKEGKWFLEYFDYREEGQYRYGKRHGEWKHYYLDTDKIRFSGSYIDGEPDGRQYYYHKNGLKKQETKYINGIKEGDWNYYDDTGLLILTITFKNDVEVKYDGSKIPAAGKK